MSTKIVQDSLRLPSRIPIIGEKDTLKIALDLMTYNRLGICCIVKEDRELVAVLSDGDLRRLLLNNQSPLPALLVTEAVNFAQRNPVSITPHVTLEVAKNLMKSREIWDLPVVDNQNHLLGLLHRHDFD